MVLCIADLRGQRQRVDCGLSNTASHCGGCGGGETLCGGECHWLEQANFCVHIEGNTPNTPLSNIKILVHMAPPFMSLSSSGPTGKKFPGAMGVYSLSQISNVSHLLVGYCFKSVFSPINIIKVGPTQPEINWLASQLVT